MKQSQIDSDVLIWPTSAYKTVSRKIDFLYILMPAPGLDLKS